MFDSTLTYPDPNPNHPTYIGVQLVGHCSGYDSPSTYDLRDIPWCHMVLFISNEMNCF